jgi:hypothetical protein
MYNHGGFLKSICSRWGRRNQFLIFLGLEETISEKAAVHFVHDSLKFVIPALSFTRSKTQIDQKISNLITV